MSAPPRRRPQSRPSRPRPVARPRRHRPPSARPASPRRQGRGHRVRGRCRRGHRRARDPGLPRPPGRRRPLADVPDRARTPRRGSGRSSHRGEQTDGRVTAKDVQALRQATGAGMMDAKKALAENDGDVTQAAQWLREKGLARSRTRDGPREQPGRRRRSSTDGRRAASSSSSARPTSSAKSDDFVGARPARSPTSCSPKGTRRRASSATEPRRPQGRQARRTSSSATVVRFEAAEGNVLDTYLHLQDGRGVNGVLVELAAAARPRLAHDIAVHIAFAKPAVPHPRRGRRPTRRREGARRLRGAHPQAEGKPEQASPKIVEGRLNGWFKEQVLLEQGFVQDDKQTDQPAASATPPSCGSPRSSIGG